MFLNKAPLIVPGQIYLNADSTRYLPQQWYGDNPAYDMHRLPSVNEYLIVTGNNRGQISYQGVGFKGQDEDAVFIRMFDPVDPIDVDPMELQELLNFCPAGTHALTGCCIISELQGDEDEDCEPLT